MKASYKEAGRTRKWLISVLAGFMAIFAFASPLVNTTNTFADEARPDGSVKEGTDEGSSRKGIDITLSEDDSETAKKQCIASGAAGSIGWIVCPVMLFLSNSANDLYEAVKPYLSVDTDIFDFNKEGGGTYEAWSVFQQFANIAFVILFMVVVISQISGIGINNYGIKKILPKLIVTAILVNVSYWLCLIIVDVSNIVGNSVQNLFTALGPTLTVNGASTAVVGVSLLVALLGGGIAFILNPAFILGLLISAVGLVVSLLTLFVLLAAREAIVVVLVVASPIAIVCYMLPNTKKVYDKWIKVAEGMLLLYPTASLLVGAGSFVSRLMMSTDAGKTFFGAFVAILISIVPIFFIPKLLVSAFAAAGNIGAKISGIGKNLGGRAQNRLGNSEAMKRAQTRWNAGTNRKGEVAGLGKVREKLAKTGAGKAMGLDRAMAAARTQMVKDRYSDQRTGSMVGEGFPAALIEQQKAAEKEELGQYIVLINNDTRNGEDEEKLFKMYDDYVAQGNKTGAAAVARIAGRRKDTASRFLAQKITGTGLDEAGRTRLAEINAEHSAVFQGVAKEIATGDNSGAYRESSPLGFQFAAEHNRNAGKVDEATGRPVVDSNYENWATSENVSRATNNYLTNSKELVGAKNSSLEEIATRMQNGTISGDERTRLQHLAQMTIDNRDKTGVWDTTKESAIYAIAAGGYAGPPRPPRREPTGEGDLDLRGGGAGGAPTGGGAGGAPTGGDAGGAPTGGDTGGAPTGGGTA